MHPSATLSSRLTSKETAPKQASMENQGFSEVLKSFSVSSSEDMESGVRIILKCETNPIISP